MNLEDSSEYRLDQANKRVNNSINGNCQSGDQVVSETTIITDSYDYDFIENQIYD